MNKLYYSPGSCSTSCHISFEESGMKYEAKEIDWDNSQEEALVSRLNPMGTLPILVIDEEQLLTQNLAIHTWIADNAPQANLLPKQGTPERADAMNWLSFVAADLHKAFSPLFGLKRITADEKAQNDARNWAVGNVNQCLDVLNKQLDGRDYILGKQFTVVDAYAFVVTGWTQFLELSITAYPNVETYMKRVAQRPAVQKVLKEEGLF